MPRLTKHEFGSLWAVFWRILLLAPLLWILGLTLLVFVLALFVIPPIYAVIAFLDGDWLLGSGVLVAWVMIVRFCRPLLQWVLQGFEYSSL